MLPGDTVRDTMFFLKENDTSPDVTMGR